MRRRGRGFDVVMGLAVASFIALEIIGPAAPAPGAPPADTFTHVDMVVDDGGLHVQPRDVPAGEVEVTLVDNRTQKTEALTVKGVQAPFVFSAGTQLRTLRVLRRYDLVPYSGNVQQGAPSDMQIIVPQLASPREPLHTVTLDVRPGGISTPYREARFEQPLFAFGDITPPDTRPWTTVVAGSTALVVRNKTGHSISCAVPSGDRVPVIRRNHRSTIHVVLKNAAPNFSVVTCTSGTDAQMFDVWTG